MVCNSCKREYNPCSMRVCPISGKPSCIYCCRKCKESYKADVGEGCRMIDAAREAAPKGAKKSVRNKKLC